jgi:hypothetical protein
MSNSEKELRIMELEITLETYQRHCDFQIEEVERAERKIKQYQLEKRLADSKVSELSILIMATEARLSALKNGLDPK